MGPLILSAFFQCIQEAFDLIMFKTWKTIQELACGFSDGAYVLEHITRRKKEKMGGYHK
jgi:hypothetical protein